MTHLVTCNDPFTVIYFHNGQHKQVEYAVPLTNMEIRGNYNYIVFDTEKMSSMKVKNLPKMGLMLMDSHMIVCDLPKVSIK